MILFFKTAKMNCIFVFIVYKSKFPSTASVAGLQKKINRVNRIQNILRLCLVSGNYDYSIHN